MVALTLELPPRPASQPSAYDINAQIAVFCEVSRVKSPRQIVCREMPAIQCRPISWNWFVSTEMNKRLLPARGKSPLNVRVWVGMAWSAKYRHHRSPAVDFAPVS
jgi:hypothetical protein